MIWRRGATQPSTVLDATTDVSGGARSNLKAKPRLVRLAVANLARVHGSWGLQILGSLRSGFVRNSSQMSKCTWHGSTNPLCSDISIDK